MRRAVRGTVLAGLSVLAAAGTTSGARSAGAGVSVASDGSTVTVAGSRIGGRSYLDVRSQGPSPITCRDLVTIEGGLIEAEGGGATGDGGWPALDTTRVARWRYWLECRYPDGTLVGLADGGRGFVYVDEIFDVDAWARRYAQDYISSRVAPALSIGSSPPGRTLVGVPTWFWVGGVDATPITETHDVLGHSLVLHLVVSAVTWDFGDGESLELGPSGLGRAGQPGAAVHTYRSRTTTAGPTVPATVRATVSIDISYTLDGNGPFTVDPPLQASATGALVVREAQAVIRS